ncbi:MAG: hypothetical protein CUN56_14610, partial [Phototrophicales bacterium]
GYAMCAILNNGRAKCWGNGGDGALGNGLTANQNTPVDLISPLSCAADKYVFVTSKTYDGNLGGVLGADNICQALADRANLPGRYLAWLSDNTGSPSTRFNRALTNYKLTDGTTIANGWSDLTDGTIDNQLVVDENGNTLPNAAIWSNTAGDGYPVGNLHCKNWTTNSSASIRGKVGNNFTTIRTWTDNNFVDAGCNAYFQFYCFQQ